MVRTRVGYSGGTSNNPTYLNLGDHTEAIQIDYDPSKISYESLLDIFWDSHAPMSRAISRQYRTAIFYHNENQKKAAERSRENLASVLNGKIITEIELLKKFYLAEGYHQKHRLRSHYSVITEFETIYPQMKGLISSTAAARVNGYLGGYGTCEMLKAEISGFGLSAEMNKYLLKEVCLGNTETSCSATGCN